MSWFLGLSALVALLGGSVVAALFRANRRLRASREELALERERYERVVEGAEEGVWDWNLLTGDLFLSPKLTEMVKRPEKELTAGGKALEALCHPDDLPALKAALHVHFAARTPLHAEFRMASSAGGYRWYLARGRAQWDESGRATRVSGSLADITGPKRIEATLRHLARARTLEKGGQFWRNLATHLAENLEMDYVCIDALEEGSLHATTLAFCSDGNFLDNVTYALKDTPCGAVVEKGVCCFPSGVARLFPLDEVLLELRAESYAGTLVWDGEGRPVGLIAVIGRKPLEDQATVRAVLEIAGARAAQELERARAEREREELEKRLAQTQKLEAVGRLAGGVAHEFNNMLGVILGHAQLALDVSGTASPIADDLVQIRLAARRSADTASRLLAFARKQAVTPRVVDLNRALDQALSTVRKVVGEEIAVEFNPAPELWRVRLDPSQLELVLASLAANSADAIDGVGRIRVETFNHTLSLGEGEAHPGDYAALSFADDGRGIAPGDLTKIFEPFYTTKEVGAGSGLGLATVHGIAAQNGGFVRVESEQGRGATFTLFFPAVAGLPEEALEKEGEATGRTILIVEDERAILSLARKVLKARGYEVLTAATPAEALNIARTQPPGSIDLLITDVVMPEMNGQRLCVEMRKLLPDLRCLYMSGYAAEVVALRGIMEGEVDFLPKPFELEELCGKVASALAR